MNIYSQMLDTLVVEAEAALGVRATRDPSVVESLVSSDRGCIYVQFPVHFDRLLDGPNLEVPVSLVAPAPADLHAVDWLLDHYDALVQFCGARLITSGPIDIGSGTYPAVTATAQIALGGTP